MVEILPTMQPKCLIVFDLDGVLVDESASYREAIRRTARLFFSGSRGGPLPDPLFSLEDLDTVKRRGGVNNDWDATHRVICLLAARARDCASPPAGDPWSAYETAVAQCDVSDLAAFLRSTPTPLANLLSENPRKNREWVDRFYRGDIGGENIIKQIFQEVYLGESLFKRVYGTAPRVHHGSGMIARETLIPEKPLLEQLSEKYLLAVATGRPAFEADHALTAFGIRRLFAMVLSHDDCIAEERRRGAEDGRPGSLLKPDPYMLDSIASRAGEEIGCRYYVGDLPDDMLAAARAKSGYIGIGVVPDAASGDQRRRELFDAGARSVIGDLSRLAETVEETKETKE